MLAHRTSGQFLYFSMVSSISGFAVTSISGAISGRRCTDGGSMSLLSGNVVEDAGGLYHANLYDFDTSGNNIGYLFTASGCVPVSYMVVTTLGCSGDLFTASGINTAVPPATLSGVVANSGLTVTVLPATLSGVVANSGLNVVVPIASISGTNVVVPGSTLSGTIYLASGSINSGVLISGVFVTSTASAPASGTIYLASGHFLFGSGRYFLASGSITSGLIASGIVFIASGPTVTVPIASISGVVANSGLFVSVPTATISGTVISTTGLSGQIYPPVKYNTLMQDSVTQKGSTSSGNVFLNSGSSVVDNWYVGNLICLWSSGGSGEIRTIVSYQGSGNLATLDTPFTLSGVPLSGLSYVIWTADNIASTSGQNAVVGTNLDKSGYNLTSGGSFIASGPFVNVPIASISGAVANSGLFVNVPIATVSGLNAVVPPATLSGVVANSGLFVSVPIATLSGLTANSGLTVTLIGSTVSGKIFPPPQYSSLVADSVTQKASTSSGNIFLNSGSVPVDNWYVGDLVYLYSSGGSGQVRTIVSYQGSGNLATLDQPWWLSGVPLSGISYVIWAADSAAGTSGQGVIVGTNLDKSGYNLTSGGSFIASGTNAVVPPASLSGVVVNSGLFVSVPIATISGTFPNVLSGTVFLASGSITSGVISSGVYVTATASISSGQVWLASGSITSGVICSGVFVSVPPSTLSGVVPNTLSGTVFLASGSVTSGVISSGVYVTATASIASGQVWLASGSITSGVIASGVYVTVPPATLSGVVANSGLFVSVPAATLSGVVPASGTLWLASGSLSGQQVTLTSGQSWIASGINAVVPPVTLSGVVANSGLFVTVPIATISGAVANSGLFVTVPLATLSGIQPISGTTVTVPIASISGTTVNVLSGTVFLASGSVTSGVISSGVFVTATATIGSGALSGQQVTLVSGQSWTASGINAVVPPSTLSGVVGNSGLFVSVPISTLSGVVANSGLNVVVPIASISGTNVIVPPATLSGVVANSGLFVSVPIATLSGVQPVSGATVTVPIASISGVSVLASQASGTTYLASGHFLFGSGQYWLASGGLSGQVVNLNSGQSFIASGINVVVPRASLSGLIANSGLFVTLPIASVSGITVIAGTVSDKSGYMLSASGTDQIIIESGMNMRQAVSVIAAAAAGQLSGAGTTSFRIQGANVSGITRIIATVDLSGNRSAVTVQVPT